FYLGELELFLFGPIKSLLTGTILIMFSLKYLKNAKPLHFALSIFGFLCATRFFVLAFPPFGESLTGLYYEAVWLVRNNMDWIGLHKAGTYATGGPQFYPTSIYSYLIALLMKLIPNTKLLYPTLHLINFASTAVILTILKSILERITSKEYAVLGSLAFFFYPAISGMVELINLEMSGLFFTMLTMHFLIKQKNFTASLTAIISMLIRGQGITACFLVVLCTISAVFFNSSWKTRISNLFIGLLTIGFAAGKVLIRQHLMGGADQPANNIVGLFVGAHEIKNSPWFWIYSFILLILTIRFFLTWKIKNYSFKDLIQLAENNRTILLTFLIAGSWFLMFLNYNFLLYRYQTSLAPFMVIIIFYALYQLGNNRQGIKIFIFILLGLSLFSSHGFAYRNPWIKIVRDKCTDKKDPTCLEHSLEYRNYLTLEKMIVKEVEETLADKKVGAPWGASNTLGIPEMGYTDKQLDIIVFEMTMHHLGLKPVPTIDQWNPLDYYWVVFDHYQKSINGIDFPRSKRDTLIKTLQYGNLTARIIQGGYSIVGVYTIIKLQRSGMLDKYFNGEIPQEFLRNL
ncbi:hypothetical protein ACFL49_03225, partial [Candidatus Omnitrophota bacterium]